jgi:hypothetical protein
MCLYLITESKEVYAFLGNDFEVVNDSLISESMGMVVSVDFNIAETVTLNQGSSMPVTGTLFPLPNGLYYLLEE